jgi:DNA-binding SARP family transcriptional activator
MTSAPKYRLTVFGGLAIADVGGSSPAIGNHRKKLAFLAALAVGGDRGVSRDRLLAWFWPESDTDRARNSLNQFAYSIRRELGDDALVGTSDEVRLNPDVVGSDIADFRAALAAGAVETVTAVCVGPFLDAVFLRDVPDFERWVGDTRATLADEYAHALDTALDRATANQRHRDALRWARLLAQHDPLSTRHALRLIQALERSGDVPSALRHAEIHAARLRAELEIAPDPALDREVARLRTGALSTVVQAPAGTPVPQTERAGLEGAHFTKRKNRWFAPAAIAITAVATLSLTVPPLLRTDRAPAMDSSRVLVPVFLNRSGDAALDTLGAIAADWVTQGLSAAEIGKVVDGPTAFEISRATMKDATPADSLWSVLSRRTRAGLILAGTIQLEHDSIVLDAHVTDMRDGTVLRAIPVIRASRRDPMRGIEILRERAVGAVATIIDPRLASLSGRSSTPPLIEAYQDFLKGLAVYRRDNDRPALILFLSAARRDSTFMLPLVWAYLVERNYFGVTQQPTATSDSILAVLESHRDKLALIDRYALDAFQAERAGAPKEERLAAIQRVSALAPASNWSYLEAVLQLSVGRPSEARAALQRIDPEHGWASTWSPYWQELSITQHYLHDYAGELETALRSARSQPIAGAPGITPGLRIELRALIGLGLIDSALARLRSVPVSLNLLDLTAVELRAHGHRRLSDSLYQVGLERHRAEAAGRPGWAVYFARYAIDAGSLEDARVAAQRVLSDSVDRGKLEAHAILGMVAANRGDRATAEAELRTIETFKGEHDIGLAAGYQAMVAGYLHDRQLVLKYFAEMESGTGDFEPALVATHRYRGLLWLDHDPAVRRPYITGAP